MTRAHTLLLAKLAAFLAFDVACVGRILGWW